MPLKYTAHFAWDLNLGQIRNSSKKKKKRKKEKSWGWGGSKRHFKSQEENYEISVCLDLCMSHSFSSVAQLCLTLCDPRDCSTPSLPVHHQLPELTQSHVHWVDDAFQPFHPLSSPSPPTYNFPSITVFTNESVLHIRWPKYWSFSNSASNEYSELISFRMDWLDLLVVQGTLKSLLQHHSSKA